MMRMLLFVKHHLRWLWHEAELLNGLLFRLRFDRALRASAEKACRDFSSAELRFRLAQSEDIAALADFFCAQPEESFQYFKPHDFDEKSLRRQLGNPAFYPFLAVNEQNAVVGYFMIRFFISRQAFAGFLVGAGFRGRGMAKVMCRIIFSTCWSNRFRTFATVSRKNKAALAAYRSINDFKIIRELPEDYIYIEYVPGPKCSPCIK